MRNLSSVVLLATVVAGAAAQDLPRRERVFTFSGPAGAQEFAVRRGRLGITVDMRAEAARDTAGALVAGVTAGGAAERAGIRAGDILTRFNGTRLAVTTPADEPEEDQSRPALRLLRFAARLDPGDTVRLEVRRDGRPMTFTFQAEESDMDVMVRRMPPGIREMLPGMTFGGGFPGEGSMRVMISGADGLDDLELVRINPGLGEYFGTTEGLLVVNVGEDTTLGLRAGDVILSIGGRRPTTPVHAMRILSTYDARESVSFDVMRQRRRATVSGRMPERRDNIRWRVRPNSFEIPVLPRTPFPGFDDEEDGPRIRLRQVTPARPAVVIVKT